MSVARRHLAIFERPIAPQSNLSAEKTEYTEVAKAFVDLNPLTGRELIQAQQVQAQTTHKVNLIWTPTVSAINSACRMKIAKPVAVNNDVKDEVNYRIFNLESVLNVREENRVMELMVMELMVVEKV